MMDIVNGFTCVSQISSHRKSSVGSRPSRKRLLFLVRGEKRAPAGRHIVQRRVNGTLDVDSRVARSAHDTGHTFWKKEGKGDRRVTAHVEVAELGQLTEAGNQLTRQQVGRGTNYII